MTGWILKNLNYVVKKKEREWKANSDIRKEYSYDKIRGILFVVSRKPLKGALIIFVVFFIITFIVSQFQFIKINLNLDELDRSSLISFHATIWSIQTTITALIYPIVIGFVSLLLQKRDDARSFLNIYLHDTAAIFSGLCALSLIFLHGIQYFFVPIVDTIVILNWLYVNTSFLLINVLLTSYFLYQTFAYLKPQSRIESLKKYLINEIWPTDFKKLMKPILFENILVSGLIGTKYADNNLTGSESPTISTSEFLSNRYGKSAIEINLRNNSYLYDIRFRFLSLAVKQWERKAKQKENEKHSLIFPLTPGKGYKGQQTICKIEGSIKLNWIQKLLIKRSFVFRTKNKNHHLLSVHDLLKDLKNETLRSLHNNDHSSFVKSLNDLEAFIVLLIKASAVPSFNYSTIRKIHYFGRPEYEEWLNTVRELSSSVAVHINNDDLFISEIIYTPQSLLIGLSNEQFEIKSEVLQLAKSINYHISQWWVKTIGNQGVYGHNNCKQVKLKPPFNGTYNNILRRFIGQWETIKKRNLLPADLKTTDWNDFKTANRLLQLHLLITTELLFDALAVGDRDRSNFLLDTLLKWFTDLRSSIGHHNSGVINNSKFLNSTIIESDWTDIERIFDLSNFEFLNYKPEVSILNNTLHNFWVDMCCVVLYKLVQISLNCKDVNDSLSVFAYRSIYNGNHPFKTGNSIQDDPKPLSSIDDLFTAALRHHFSGFIPDSNYRKTIDDFIDKLFPRINSNMISSRVYTGSGRENLESLQIGLLITLLNISPKKWNPESKYHDNIEGWIYGDIQQIESLQRVVSAWINRLGDNDFKKYESFYKTLNINRVNSFEQAVSVVKEGLQSFKDKIESVRLDLLEKSSIDKSILYEIEKNSTKGGFEIAKNKFPLFLFDDIQHVKNNLKKYSVPLYKAHKGAFTTPKLATHPSDQQLYDNLLADYIPLEVWENITSSIKFDKIEVADAIEYWDKIKEFESDSIKNNFMPILIINNIHDPKWLWDWIIGREANKIPNDLKFEKKEEINHPSYVGHFNDTAIFRVNGLILQGTSYLMNSETLKGLNFAQFSNGQFISVKSIENTNPEWIDLEFTWMFEADTEQLPAVKMVHTQ